MATIVCQGLQSCLESPSEPRTLRLKLLAHHLELLPQLPKPFFPDTRTNDTTDQKCHQKGHDKEQTTSENYSNGGGWDFLQSLSQSSKLDLEKTTYVHPLVKRSLSSLSEKSLQLCTENLGNETGCDMITDSTTGILSNMWRADSIDDQKRRHVVSGAAAEVNKKAAKASPGRGRSEFPPPLTTMSGSESLQVRPHREDGRLIIKAVKGPSRSSSCFHAERSEGRLRLCLLEDYHAPNFDYEEKILECEKEGYENDIKEENDVKAGEGEEEVGVGVEEKQKEKEKDKEGEAGEREKGKIGIIREKFERGNSNGNGSVRRCKEEGGEIQYHHEKKANSMLMLNWEPLWVATS